MFITVVAYKPSGSDYCVGCHIESWDSDIQVMNFESTRDAAEKVSHYIGKNKNDTGQREPDWDMSIIIDGISTQFGYGDIDCWNNISLESYDDNYDNSTRISNAGKSTSDICEQKHHLDAKPTHC